MIKILQFSLINQFFYTSPNDLAEYKILSTQQIHTLLSERSLHTFSWTMYLFEYCALIK